MMSLSPRLSTLFFAAMISILRDKVAARFIGLSLLSSKAFDSKWNSTSFDTKPTFQNNFQNESLTLHEETVFEGYRNIVRRHVKLPTGENATYDILTQKHLSVVVFIWDSTTSTTTLIREYHPGPERYMYGTVAGMYENKKHDSPLEAAMFELEEEAQLMSSQWHSLLLHHDINMPFDKYSTNKFYPYLALDCKKVLEPKPMDAEEFISVHPNVTYHDLIQLINSGQMNVVSTYTILLAFNKLDELGIPYKGMHPSS